MRQKHWACKNRFAYRSDTDTLFIGLTDRDVTETKELNENLLVDLDKDGKVVSMTIEHARQEGSQLDFSYQLMAA